MNILIATRKTENNFTQLLMYKCFFKIIFFQKIFTLYSSIQVSATRRVLHRVVNLLPGKENVKMKKKVFMVQTESKQNIECLCNPGYF
jgi:hypothetical protein